MRIPGNGGSAEATGAGRYVLSGTDGVTLFVCVPFGDCVWSRWSLSVVVFYVSGGGWLGCQPSNFLSKEKKKKRNQHLN